MCWKYLYWRYRKNTSTIKLYEILKKIEIQICTGKKFYSNQIDEIKNFKKKLENLLVKTKREKIIQIAIKKKTKNCYF